MPVVELDIPRLRGLLGGSATRKAIVEALPFLGLDIESESGSSVRVEYSPNRPDYSTDYGIALGLEGLLGIRRGGVALRIGVGGGYRIAADPSVSGIRPSVTGICAVGRAVDGGMIRQLVAMQEDLHLGIGRGRAKSAIGIHDLAAVRFPLRYTAVGRDHEFAPLGQAGPMRVDDILSGTEAGRRYGGLLGGDPGRVPVLLDSEGGTVSLPPVINASSTAVTTRTRGLFVEVTGRGKRDVEDALSVVSTVLQRAGFGLRRVGISGAGNSTPALSRDRIISLDPKLVAGALGLEMTASRVASCLRRSRIGASRAGGRVRCAVPRYRFDIFGPMDLVEEVALGYGIAGLEPRLSPPRTVGGTTDEVRRLRVVDEVMVGLGYTEALSSSLTGAGVLYGSTGRDPRDPVAVLDSKSSEHTVLRDSLLPGLASALSRNVHRAYPQRLYETGTVFLRGGPVREEVNLAAVAAHGGASFSEIKSVLQSALRTGFGLEAETRTAPDPLFRRGRSAGIVAGGCRAGVIGEVGPDALERLRIRVPVVGFEVTLTGLIFGRRPRTSPKSKRVDGPG